MSDLCSCIAARRATLYVVLPCHSLSVVVMKHQLSPYAVPQLHPPPTATNHTLRTSLTQSDVSPYTVHHVRNTRNVRRPGRGAPIARHTCYLGNANRSCIQVAGELKKMTAFIRQEALEKAKEIQFKADEVIIHGRHWPQAPSDVHDRNSQSKSRSSSDRRHPPLTRNTRRNSNRHPCHSRSPNPQSPTNRG